MSNVLVIGGLGFIGSHTARALLDAGALDAGARVIVTRHRRGDVPAFLERAIVEDLDVTDRERVRAVCVKHDVHAIVHLAAHIGDPIEVIEKSTQALVNVLAVARERSMKRVVVASTVGVYGGAALDDDVRARGWREDAALSLAAAHAIPAQKKWSESIAGFAAACANVDVVVARVAGIYGPRYRGMGSVPSILAHAAARGERPDMTRAHFGGKRDDGYDHCYVEDCGRGLALLATSTTLAHRTYNVASGIATNNATIAAAVKREAPDFDVALDDGGGPAVALSIERLRADTGYAPRFSINDGIASYVAWLRAGNAF